MKLNVGTLLLVVVVPGFLLFMYVGALAWTPWRIVGVAIFVPAFLLCVLARIELGRAFSIKAKASTLVTTGLYARIHAQVTFTKGADGAVDGLVLHQAGRNVPAPRVR